MSTAIPTEPYKLTEGDSSTIDHYEAQKWQTHTPDGLASRWEEYRAGLQEQAGGKLVSHQDLKDLAGLLGPKTTGKKVRVSKGKDGWMLTVGDQVSIHYPKHNGAYAVSCGQETYDWAKAKVIWNRSQQEQKKLQKESRRATQQEGRARKTRRRAKVHERPQTDSPDNLEQTAEASQLSASATADPIKGLVSGNPSSLTNGPACGPMPSEPAYGIAPGASPFFAGYTPQAYHAMPGSSRDQLRNPAPGSDQYVSGGPRESSTFGGTISSSLSRFVTPGPVYSSSWDVAPPATTPRPKFEADLLSAGPMPSEQGAASRGSAAMGPPQLPLTAFDPNSYVASQPVEQWSLEPGRGRQYEPSPPSAEQVDTSSIFGPMHTDNWRVPYAETRYGYSTSLGVDVLAQSPGTSLDPVNEGADDQGTNDAGSGGVPLNPHSQGGMLHSAAWQSATTGAQGPSSSNLAAPWRCKTVPKADKHQTWRDWEKHCDTKHWRMYSWRTNKTVSKNVRDFFVPVPAESQQVAVSVPEDGAGIKFHWWWGPNTERVAHIPRSQLSEKDYEYYWKRSATSKK